MIRVVRMNKVVCDCCKTIIVYLDSRQLAKRIKQRLTYEDRNEKTWSLGCGHQICYNCVDHVNTTVCPICYPDKYGKFWCLKHWVLTPGKLKCIYSGTAASYPSGRRHEKYKKCTIVPFYKVAGRV